MKKTYLICCCVVALLATSCKDYLVEEMVSGISYEHYDTEDGIKNALNATYAALRDFHATENVGSDLNLMGTHVWTDATAGKPFNEYSAALNSTAGSLATVWTSYYRGINSANVVIKRTPTVAATSFLTTPANRNIWVGEARYLRAFYYFHLVQLFGRIPLELNENLEARKDFKRASVEAVYQAIITDLRFASQHLPLTQRDYGRATRGAANHLLAKVYLTRGSAITDQRGQKPTDLDSAAHFAEAVINSNVYQLVPDYARLIDFNNQRNSEVIFSIVFNPDVRFGGFDKTGNWTHVVWLWGYDLVAGMKRDIPNGRPGIRIVPTDYTLDIFDRRNDARFYKNFKWAFMSNNAATIPRWTAANAPNASLVGKPKFAEGDTAIYLSMDRNVSDAAIARKSYTWIPRNKFVQGTQKRFPVLMKSLDPARADLTIVSSRDWVYARLGETYLIAAEAHGRMGRYDKAVQHINKLRERAAYKEGELKPAAFVTTEGGKQADLTKSTFPQLRITVDSVNSVSKTINFIMHERTRELLGEGHERYDLLRNELLIEWVKRYNPLAVGIQPHHKLMPIPQTVHIDRLTDPTNKDHQNEGY
ncbi:MAG: RagB/SusD family nutrient uptake outer membrane protein [Runella sp.]